MNLLEHAHPANDSDVTATLVVAPGSPTKTVTTHVVDCGQPWIVADPPVTIGKQAATWGSTVTLRAGDAEKVSGNGCEFAVTWMRYNRGWSTSSGATPDVLMVDDAMVKNYAGMYLSMLPYGTAIAYMPMAAIPARTHLPSTTTVTLPAGTHRLRLLPGGTYDDPHASHAATYPDEVSLTYTLQNCAPSIAPH